MKIEENINREEEAAIYEQAATERPGGDDFDGDDFDDEYVDDPEETDDATEGEDEESTRQPRPTLKEVIEDNAREDEKPFSSTLALRTILGGDILNTQAIRRQVWLILLITVFSILYVSNRYSCQKQLIKIDKLNTTLKKSKYKTLSLSSVLTERCRESHVVELLQANNDSTIHPADQPPYIIMIPN